MEVLDYTDVERIVRLLGEVAGMRTSIAERRRAIMQGIAQLVEADVWVWVHSRISPGNTAHTVFQMLDGGWTDDVERGRFITAMNDKEIGDMGNVVLFHRPHTTRLRQECISEERESQKPVLDRWTQLSGLREGVFSVYPLDTAHHSAIGFYRRNGRATFDERQRRIVHLITSQIDWLHRADTEVPGNNDRLLSLTPRQREILIHLLGGASRKEIAARVNLSEHTIADYTKVIYRALGVNSRAELSSLFMAGGTGGEPSSD